MVSVIGKQVDKEEWKLSFTTEFFFKFMLTILHSQAQWPSGSFIADPDHLKQKLPITRYGFRSTLRKKLRNAVHYMFTSSKKFSN
jgi:hypothetical protein